MMRVLRISLIVAVGLYGLALAPTAHAVAPATSAISASSVEQAASASTTPPLVVLIDTSGSMSDTVQQTDGTGEIVKLEAAQVALREPISNQPPGARVGIRTYPGGESVDGCDTGEWKLNPKDKFSSTDALNKIDGLTAGGDTPTGPALAALVEDLTNSGYREANILVVSDGVFTCGSDPCEVAKELAGSGFEVSIQAVGFDIDPAGRQDLECMAQATGGKYFDATDSEDLSRVITELTTPQFELKIEAPEHPVAGKLTTIRATVTNKSVYQANNVQLRLAFRDNPSNLLSPRIVPPLIKVGSLPPGKSASRSWSFVAGTLAHPQKGIYSISASSIETLPLQATGQFTTVVPGYKATDAGPILRDLVKNRESLVILGDSFSSGEGAKNYLPQSDGVAAKCHRSVDTYLAPTFTAAKVNVAILACSGAVTWDLLGPQIDGGDLSGGTIEAQPQLEQLLALPTTPGAAVMTIGGNDIGFKDIVTKCMSPVHKNLPILDSCNWNNEYATEIVARPAQIEDSLVETYKNTWAALNSPKFVEARGGRFAPVVVLAYPKVVHSSQLGRCIINGVAGFNTGEVKIANELQENLNTTIGKAVERARSDGFEIYYVDQTSLSFRPNHTVCDSASMRWVNQAVLDPNVKGDPVVASESLHPNKDGYLAESHDILEWSNQVVQIEPDSNAKKFAQSPLVFLHERPPVHVKTVDSPFIDPTDTMFIDVPTMGDNPVTVTIHSEPQLLGTIVPDADGRVRGVVHVPSNIAFGSHQLVLEGWDTDGKLITHTITIEIKPPTPWWVFAVGILGLLFLVAIPVGLLFSRRRSRRKALQPA